MLLAGLAAVLCSCGTTRTTGSSYTPVGLTDLRVSNPPPPENQLLDVAVAVFTSDAVEGEAVAAQHTSDAIRKAELHYMPHQLTLALRDARRWGEVRVLPLVEDGHGFDLVVRGHVAESANGRTALTITAVDATGREWLKRAYVIQLRPGDFINEKGPDPARSLYNRIANDLADAMSQADGQTCSHIRQVSRMAFAARVSPEPFADYVGRAPNGLLTLRHLPADDDPAWLRIQKIHGRDRVFAELVDKHYANYGKEMADPYTGWRREIVAEREALQRAKKSGWEKAAIGAVLLGSAVALQASGVKDAGAAKVLLGAAGIHQIAAGVSDLKQQKMHRLALEELTQSFSAAAAPIVMDFEGRQVELRGTAEEQYKRWSSLLRELYREETGLPGE